MENKQNSLQASQNNAQTGRELTGNQGEMLMSEEKSKEYWKNYQEHEPQKPLDDRGLPLSEGRKPQTPPPPPPVVKVKKEKGNE
ncbi:MAG: hypothetical protein HY731_04860 [Candidatus Tectomicrobia bacterium]|nr:hypothetical protein [Candidatus Tectomicrobia bacterium]